MSGFEGRYRRLLWAYPGPYRRRHGAEIVTTLLDLAEAGHGGPSAGQRVHLVACGLRQRFRLPAGRPPTVLATVFVAMLGALGTAGGTWLGWQTAAAVPSGQEMRALTAAMSAGNPGGVPVDRWQTAMNGPAAVARVTDPEPNSAGRIRTTLADAGWRVAGVTSELSGYLTTGGIKTALERPGGPAVVSLDPDFVVPTRWIRFSATKGGLSLTGETTSVVGHAEYGAGMPTDMRVDVWALDNGAVRPLTIAGLLLGVLAGWLLTAALAYRVRRSQGAHWLAVGVLGLTALAAAVVPAVDFYRTMYQVMTYDTAATLVAARGSRTWPDPAGPEREPMASS
jgi:hypothetical protein